MSQSTIVIAPQPAETPDYAPAPVAELTVLDRIKAQLAVERQKAAASCSFRLPVPRNPSVVIEFTALTQERWGAVNERAAKSNEKTIDTNAAILMEACSGVYLEFEDEMYAATEGLGGRAPSFATGDLEALGKVVGVPYGGVRSEWVRDLYVTDGDLISTVAAVLDLSGFSRGEEIEASVKGK